MYLGKILQNKRNKETSVSQYFAIKNAFPSNGRSWKLIRISYSNISLKQYELTLEENLFPEEKQLATRMNKSSVYIAVDFNFLQTTVSHWREN